MENFKISQIQIDSSERISITLERYTELIRREERLRIIRSAFESDRIQSFDYDDMFGAIFGEVKGDERNA